MRIRILHIPRAACIDGVRLEQFIPGHQYEVGNTLGALFLCEGWAEPIDDPAPALVIPLRDLDADKAAKPKPRNLTRETYPPYGESTPSVAFERRRRSRRPSN